MIPSSSRLFQRFRQWLPGGTLGARVVWFWHLAAALTCHFYLDQARSPEKMRFSRQAAEGLKHKLSDYIEIGLWKAAVFHLIVSVFLLLTVRWWGNARSSTIETRPTPLAQPMSSPWFFALLAILLIGATGLRLPRMSLSYWGDEGWALSAYVHGNYQPADGKDWQSEIIHKPVPWASTLWSDSNGGNHYFFSVLQRLTLNAWRTLNHHPPTAFDEAVSRLPPLIFGLTSIALAGLFLRWLGRPRAGLILSLLLTLHPWHIRYSTEARGYALMLGFFIAFIWLLFLAARDGRWRLWFGVGFTAFLCVWSWKLAALSIVAANAVVLVHLLFAQRGGALPDPSWPARWTAASRLIVANLTGGALCVALVMPAVMQSPEVTTRFQKMGKPMNLSWLENSISGVFIGVPWRRAIVNNPVEAPLTETLAAHPLISSIGIFGVLAVMLLGLIALLRRHSIAAQLCLSIFIASIIGAALFKWRLRVEWIYWYFFPLIVPATVLFAIGLESLIGPSRSRAKTPLVVASILIPAAWFFTILPFLRLVLIHPYEAQRESFLLTRGRHEPWKSHGPYTGPSKVITCHLWRHIDLYDPRALLTVRDAAALTAQMRRTDEIDGELYFVVGMIAFAEATAPELMALLRDPAFFDPGEKLWAQEHIHHLETFRYHKGSAAQLPLNK